MKKTNCSENMLSLCTCKYLIFIFICSYIVQITIIFRRRQHNLEEEHAELEYQIRVLMSKPDHTKTDTEKAREEELIQRYIFNIYEFILYILIIHINF